MPARRQTSLVRLRSNRDRTRANATADRSAEIAALLTALQSAVDVASLAISLQTHLPKVVAHDWAAIKPSHTAPLWLWQTDGVAPRLCDNIDLGHVPAHTQASFCIDQRCTDPLTLHFLRSLGAPTGRYVSMPIEQDTGFGVLYVAGNVSKHWSVTEQHYLTLCAAALQLALTRIESKHEIQILTRNTRLLDAVRCAVAHTLDLDVVLRQVVEQVAETYGYSLVSLYLLETNALRCRHQVGYNNVIGTVSLTSGVMARAVRQRKTVWVEDIAAEPDFIAAIPGIVSEIAIPLQTSTTVYGVLNIEAPVGQQLNAADVMVLEAVGVEVSVAIERAMLYTATLRQAHQLAVIEQLRAAIASQLDAQYLGETIVRSLQQVLQCEFVSLWTLQNDVLQLRAYTGGYQDIVSQLALDHSLNGQCVRLTQPLFVENVHAESAYLSAHADIVAGMYIPLQYGHNVLGTLCIESRTALSPQDFETVMALHEQIAAAVEQSCRVEAAYRAREREAFISQLLVVTNNVEPDNWPNVWSALVQRLGKLLEVSHCIFNIFGHDQPRQLIAWSADHTQRLAESLQALAAESGDQQSIDELAAGRRFFIQDLAVDQGASISNMRQMLLLNDVRAVAAVPVLGEGRVCAAIVVLDNQIRTWAVEDITLLEAVSQHLAVALRQAFLRSQEVQRRRELEIVYQIAIEINGHHDLQALLQTIVDRACMVLNSDNASLYLLTPEGNEAELRVGLNIPPKMIGARVELDIGLVGRVMQSKQSVRIANYSQWQQRNQEFDFADFGAVLGVPLIAQQRVVGVIIVAHVGTAKQFRETDQRLMELLAAQAAQAIETTQLLERVRRRTVEMEALYANALALSADQAPDQVLRSIVERAQTLIGAESIGLHVVDEETGELVLTVVTNTPRALVGSRLAVGEGVAGRAALSHSTVIVDDYQQWPYRPNVYADLPWRTMMGVPMLSGDRVVGVLGLAHIVPDKQFTADDQRLMELFASQAVQVVEHARRFERERVLRADAETSLQEMKAVLQELEQANEHMSRIEKFRMLGELASEVAHDFNNALVSILGNTQFLLLDETQPDRMEMLRSVEAAARDSVTMIKRIQEFGRSQSNPNQEHIDINALVKDAVTMTQSRWRDFVEPTMDLRAQQMVRGNQTELRRVLMNLIVNALDAMPHGGTLKLSTYDVGTMQCIEVQDTGTGMLEHIQSRIFDPFFTTKAVGMGTGLGLSICQQIITQHGGTIAVRSKVGSGTTFTIRLPSHSDSQHDHQLFESTTSATALIYQPEPLLRAVIERFFAQQQFAVTIVEHGTELQRVLSGQQWDVVIVDASLSKAVKLARVSASTFVVVLVDGTLDQAYDGADVVLVKPVDIAQLHQLVADIRTRTSVS